MSVTGGFNLLLFEVTIYVAAVLRVTGDDVAAVSSTVAQFRSASEQIRAVSRDLPKWNIFLAADRDCLLTGDQLSFHLRIP